VPVKKIIVEKANRLYQLPPDLMSFRRPDKSRRLLKKTELVDLASFRWPAPTDQPAPGVSSLTPADRESRRLLKEDLAGWYRTVYGVRLIPEKEVFIGGSITDIMLCLGLAFIDHGDIAFVPGLGVPLYRRVVAAAGGEAAAYAVSAQDSWQPDFERVGTRIGRVARVLFVNSPHNPTGAELNEKQMTDLAWLAARENVLVVNDAAYQTLSGHRPASLMGVVGGKKVGVEVGSFVYHFGLPYVPLAFAVGHRDIISGLKQASGLIHRHVFKQHVTLAAEAIRLYPGRVLKQVRRQISTASAEATAFMEKLQVEKAGQDTVPFAWARLPSRNSSKRAADRLLKRTRILVTPGAAFGDIGEGYLRLSLTAGAESYRDARQRIGRRRMIQPDEEE